MLIPSLSPLRSLLLFSCPFLLSYGFIISLKSPPGLCSQDQPKQGKRRRLLHDFGTWVPLGEVKVSLSNSKLFKETQGPHSDTNHDNSYRSLSTDQVWNTEPGTVFLSAVTLVYNIIQLQVCNIINQHLYVLQHAHLWSLVSIHHPTITHFILSPRPSPLVTTDL